MMRSNTGEGGGGQGMRPEGMKEVDEEAMARRSAEDNKRNERVNNVS